MEEEMEEQNMTPKRVFIGLVWLIVLLVGVTWGGTVDEKQSALRSLIQKAGNAYDDAACLSSLRELQKQPDLDVAFKSDLDKTVAQIARWMEDKDLSYFRQQITRTLDYDFGIAKDSPLYPLTCLYRGRMLAWYTLEGLNWPDKKKERVFLDKIRGLFEQAARAFPQNQIARMYLGDPIPPAKLYAVPPGAPEWAVWQREGLERLADIIEWWIAHRMRATGEYGGGWEDDCEMWRWWVPVLIGFDGPKITDAQTRFSDALMSRPQMSKGYAEYMADVEHTGENTFDTITPMMHLRPDDPVWSKRALRLAELMETLWAGRNERGFLQFKSTYFTVDKISPNPQYACDSVYHLRAVQPAVLYWQRTRDPHLTSLFSAWMDTWVDAAARSERGKPAGIIPSTIHWPDGRVGGVPNEWWDPRNAGQPVLYFFPSAMGMMTDVLLLTHHITGHEKYLQPVRSMARARLKYLSAPPPEPMEPGSEAWCASRINMSSTMAKYRLLTGREEFDDLFAREAVPYMRFRLTGDRGALAEALRANAESLRVNFAGYTSEVRYTDRGLGFPRLFAPGMLFPDGISRIRRPEPDLLYSTATGDPGGALYFPLNAVRWMTPPRDLAALVTDSGTDRLTAELFHFGDKPRAMEAELYLLAAGNYTFRLSSGKAGESAPDVTHAFTVCGPRTRISFELPPQRLCTMLIRKEEPARR